MTDISNTAWRDALAVLAYSIRQAAARSRHTVIPVVLAPERLTDKLAEELRRFGFAEIIRKPVPVPAKEVQKEFAREHMERVQGSNPLFQFAMAEETVKYWGMALTDFDKVLVLDADVMVLDPMDELMDHPADFIGVYDHGLDLQSSTTPPTQGGFLLFRPNVTDFEAIKTLTREGDWDGNGWKRSGIGFCYGGVGPDGLLPYYYNKDSLEELKRVGKENLPEGLETKVLRNSRWLAVERPIYDVVINQRLRQEVNSLDHAKTLAGVKSVHFTGDCIKPWSCFTSSHWFCKGLLEKWWELRSELEQKRGKSQSERRCVNGQYQAMAT